MDFHRRKIILQSSDFNLLKNTNMCTPNKIGVVDMNSFYGNLKMRTLVVGKNYHVVNSETNEEINARLSQDSPYTLKLIS